MSNNLLVTSVTRSSSVRFFPRTSRMHCERSLGRIFWEAIARQQVPSRQRAKYHSKLPYSQVAEPRIVSLNFDLNGKTQGIHNPGRITKSHGIQSMNRVNSVDKHDYAPPKSTELLDQMPEGVLCLHFGLQTEKDCIYWTMTLER